MTSVLNRRLRLNGSKGIWLLCLMMLAVMSCTPRKVVRQPPPRRIPPKPRPEMPTTPPKQDVDTTRIAEGPSTQPDPTELETSSAFRIGLFLPLGLEVGRRDSSLYRKSQRMLRYYAGLRLGLRELDLLREEVQIDIIDDQSNDLVWRADYEDHPGYDVLFGGGSKEDVAYLAAKAAEQKIDYLSPWSLKSPPSLPNPHYLQMKPGFHAHISKILEHVQQQGRMSDVVLLGSGRERGRIEEINRWYRDWTGSPVELETFIVDDIKEANTLELEEWVEDEERQFVFIIPMSSRLQDVQVILRMLEQNALHDRSTIYGLTDWDAPYLMTQLEGLDIRLANWEVSRGYYEDLPFIEAYFAEMKELPDASAYDGYMHGQLLSDFVEQKMEKVPTDRMHLTATDRSVRFKDGVAIKHPEDELMSLRGHYQNYEVQLLKVEDYLYEIWRPGRR